MNDVAEFLARFDRLADSNITSMSVASDGKIYTVTVAIDTIDDFDKFKSKSIKLEFTGVFDFKLAFEPNDAPFALGLGVAYTRVDEGHYFEFAAPDFDRSIEEIRSSGFFIGFRTLSYEIQREIVWD